MNTTLRILMTAGVLGALAAPALAEERQTSPTDQQPKAEAGAATAAAPASPTMKDLLGDGYEVKSVTIIPHDIVKRGGSTTDVDATMFFLQKGAQVATCYTDFMSYANGSFYTLACTEYK
jgi:hypothetical protein